MRLQVGSVSRLVPTPDNPTKGVFVKNRFDGMAEHMDVRVLQPIPYFPLARPLPGWINTAVADGIQRIPMFYLPGVLKHWDARWMERALLPHLIRLQAAGKLDVIDAHWGYPEAVACARIGRRLGVPVFATMRGHEVDYLQNHRIAPLLQEAVKSAAGVICVSHSLASLMLDAGVSEDRVHVVHNAVDRNRFHPSDPVQAREALNLSAGGPIVFSVGQLIHGKRHKVLIEAFAAVHKTLPDARLYIAGSTTHDVQHTAEVQRLIVSLGLQDAVELLGNVAPERVALFYQAADLFALMTAREGCCNAVLESLAAGLANVTTPAGDNAYFVQNDKNGEIVEIDNADAAARAMLKLLQDPLPRVQVSNSLQVDTWSGIGARLADLFAARLQEIRH